MEYLQDILTAISTVGFPIVTTGALFWYLTKQMAAHKEEIDSLKGVIQENTVALVTIKQLLEDKQS